MKTEASSTLHYSASPLKVIETKPGDKVTLKALKREDIPKDQNFSFIVNNSINDPEAWDASWFSNYE